jgi:hypothetical protein
VVVWSGRVECCGLFRWLVEVGGGGWFSKFRRVTVAGGVGVVVETFAICSKLSNGNTCSWKRT